MNQKRKDMLLKPLDFIFLKFNFFIASISILIYLFREKLEKLIQIHFVKDRLDKIESSHIPLTLVFIAIGIIIVFFSRKYIRRYYFTPRFKTLFFLVTAGYTYYRTGKGSWIFLKLDTNSLLSSVAYFDFIYLFLLGIIISIIIPRISTPSEKEEVLIYDNPLDNPDNQELFPSRASVIEGLSELIININSPSAYAVAIQSPWGTGKSSFLNFLIAKLKLKDERAIVINFYPWYAKSEKEIITHFLSTLSDSLKNYHGSLNSEIKNYTNLILALEKNQITTLIEKGMNFLSESKDINSQFEQINNCISDLKRTIYITLDDVDRLLGKEIIECLKIIRNSANFKNVIFIVAYDNEYVLKELNHQFNKKGELIGVIYSRAEQYLEKIFQLTYTLPSIDKDDILDHLKKTLKAKGIQDPSKFLKQEFYEKPPNVQNVFDFNTEEANKSIDITDYIGNIRVSNNILNSFLTAKKLIEDETVLEELFLVSILKTLYPKEALELYLNLNHYFTFREKPEFKDLNEFENNILRFANNSKVEKKFAIVELNKKTDFINLVSAIFFRHNQVLKSASYNENYKFYYRNALPKSYLTQKEYKAGISSITGLLTFINVLDTTDKTKLEDLSYKLSKDDATTKEKAIIIIAGLIYLQDNLKNRNFFQVINKILKKHKDKSIEILEEVISNYPTKNRFALSNLIFEIKYSYIKKLKNQDLPLIIDIVNGLDKFNSLSIRLLNKRIKESKFDIDIYNYYYSCSNLINESNNHVIDTNANKVMKDFVSNDVNKLSYIKSLIIPKFTPDDGSTRVFRPFINQTFNDYNGFEKFLNDTIKEFDADEELKTILKKWKIYKSNGYDRFDKTNIQ
ncbi:MAG: hypothetical protein COB98_01665 [Flavobacteriaceae bacterium]|nr:MAG: hypothetical protein COB98_01665 [Flavobacteriaceae bacterium]